MSRAVPTLVINGPTQRAIARAWVMSAPVGTVVRFDRPRRTLPQNERLHAMLTVLAHKLEWPVGSGQRRTVDAWKDIVTAALLSAKHQLDVVPGINGGFVLLGMHTSSMTKDDFGELIDLVEALAAEHGVDLGGAREPLTLPATEPRALAKADAA